MKTARSFPPGGLCALRWRLCRDLALPLVALLCLAPALRAQPSSATGGFAPGAREIFFTDFSQEPVGEFPKSLRNLKGAMEVVEKDGKRMLRASDASEFLINLPERLPVHFTLEFDLITRAEYNNTELGFEGTPTMNRSAASAQVQWYQRSVTVLGGGRDGGNGYVVMPDEIAAEIEGQPAQIAVDINGDSFKLFTNGRRIMNYPDVKFVRGRVLRVELGGRDSGASAVHLSRLRIADATSTQPATAQQQSGLMATSTGTQSGTSPVTITGLTVTAGPGGSAFVSWNPLPIAATYFVVRWNASDPACCNAMSLPGLPLTSPAWQDTLPPLAGTYAYRVIATTASGLVAAETRFNYGGAAVPPPGVPAPTGSFATGVPPTGGTILNPNPTSSPSPTGSTATGTVPTGTIVSSGGSVISSAPRAITPMPTPTGSTSSGTGSTTYVPPPPGTTGGTGSTTYVPPPPGTTGGTSSGTYLPPPPATTSGTGSTIGGTSSTTGGTGSSTASNPANMATGGSGAQFRVLLTGAKANRLTVDDPLAVDGNGDEVYGAAGAFVFNRTTNLGGPISFTQTQVYGDLGVLIPLPGRIQAGSAGPKGGIAAGNTIPPGYDPTGSFVPPLVSGQFPLQVWQGSLSPGAEAVVIIPSLWSRNIDPLSYAAYKALWIAAPPAGIILSPLVRQQLTTTSLSVGLAVLNDSIKPIPGPTFALGKDRPIGMSYAMPLVTQYQDRILVLTYEKLSNLTVGGGFTLNIPLAEPVDILLSGDYTLYLRIERTQ